MSSDTDPSPGVSVGPTHTFSWSERDFLLDGEPFQVISGALHYFRVHPDLWADRIHKARLMGLNTIETYVPWNEHCPTEGVSDFAGKLDLDRFLRLVAAEGMHAIVRPGPFICAEWDNGGLPGWLFREAGVGIRSSEPRYLQAVEKFFTALLPIVAEHQIDRGGPVIMVQIENEYGAYGDDKAYLQSLVDMNSAAGITVPMFTCDQPEPGMLEAGGLPSLLKTGTFGSRSAERLATLREHQPTGPLMCAEFWNGWFDHWGTHHHTTSAAAAANELDVILGSGASVNVYMFHGGTNFGFTNGANDKGIYEPTTTSYDYDAPLSEDGVPTEKFFAFREVIARYAPVPDEEPSSRVDAPTPVVHPRGVVAFSAVADRLGTASAWEHPPAVDLLHHYQGFVTYATDVTAKTGPSALVFSEVRDRAVVHLDGVPLGVLERETQQRVLAVPAGLGGRLEVLVEDQGRVNYGVRIGEHKGLLGSVHHDDEVLTTWIVRPIQFDLDAVRAGLEPTTGGAAGGPAFFASTFDLDVPADLHLRLDGWTKGVAFVNGFPLGRYWSRGPQGTLYVPGPATRAGENEIVVFELHGTATGNLTFAVAPDLGPDQA